MNAEQQMAALLQVVDEYRAARCRETLAQAQAEADRTITQARAAAARRLRAELSAERAQRDGLVAAALARLGTARRLQQQRRLVAALAVAWAKLEAELGARWQSHDGREQWVARQLAAARARLPAGEWTIEHPPPWPAKERECAEGWLVEAGIPAVRFVARDNIRAGLRIRCGHNMLDATLVGLLADRAAIEGRLLVRLQGGSA